MGGAIISNTGPLVALAVSGQLDLLRLLFDDVIVPEAVHHELLAGGMNHAGRAAYQQARWITVCNLAERLDPLLASVLDTGEASVIQLAGERSIARVLIDERKGRQIAREVYKLQVIGSARVLVEAKRGGHLASVEDALAAMRQHGYWLHDKIIAAVLREAGER
jgi:predicted nucleic acid-binding protein